MNTILLVDDDKITNYLNKNVINKVIRPNEVHVSENGRDALDFLIQRLSEGKAYPEIIFLDINMPVMDGFEFLEAFNKIKVENPELLLLMLTTSGDQIDVEKSRNYEINGYINKPLTEDKLRGILSMYLL